MGWGNIGQRKSLWAGGEVCAKALERQEVCERISEARMPRAWGSCREMLKRWAGPGDKDHTCILRVGEGH